MWVAAGGGDKSMRVVRETKMRVSSVEGRLETVTTDRQTVMGVARSIRHLQTRGQERARRRGQERARREGQTIDSRRGQERARRRQSAQSVQCNSHQAGKQPWTAVVRGEAALLSSVLFEFN